MSSEEANTEDSVDSLSEVSSLDDDFARIHFESGSSDEEVTNDEVDSNVWREIESESDGEFLEDHWNASCVATEPVQVGDEEYIAGM